MEKDQYAKAENIGERKVEWLIFAVYVVLLFVICCFHEPWYDEAEAWQMARGAGISDLLFYIPHYEGHPSLWYLILAIPAKLGVPYEWGLKTVSYTAALLYGWLILFRSPFPKLIRCCLPFQYFFFYQYGVISRQYGLMTLCLFLMAMAFPERNERPGRFVLPMAVLCALSGYGVVLSGGLCIAWVWDICREKKWRLLSVEFWRDRRIFWLAGLLAAALLIILQILPREDTYAAAGTGPYAEANAAVNSLAFRLLYTFFLMLPDSTVMTLLEGEAYLDKSSFGAGSVGAGVFLGVLFLIAVFFVSSRRNRHYFFIPYTLFGIFSALVYFNAHHIGILLSFTVFWLWTALEDEGRCEAWKRLKERITLQEQEKDKLRKAGKFALLCLLLPSLYWSAAASVLEITKPYYYGREAADFMRETGLSELKVMAGYDVISSPELLEKYDMLDCINTELVPRPVAILPYFEHNFCRNLNMGRDDAGYALHRIPDRTENREALEAWKNIGPPDVIIEAMNLKLVFGDEVSMKDYAPVYEYAPFANIWKSYISVFNAANKEYIYLRRDLLEEYGLEEIGQPVLGFSVN